MMIEGEYVDLMDDDCDIEGNPNTNIYEDNGYDDRDDYLQQMSDEYNIPFDVVCDLADVLGRDEDFDGLVSSLKDAERMSL